MRTNLYLMMTPAIVAFAVVQEGCVAMQQLLSVVEELEKGKWEIAATADVRVEGECHLFAF